MPLRTFWLTLAIGSCVMLAGCGEGPAAKHPNEETSPGSTIRGAALDGSDDKSEASPAAKPSETTAGGGGVPTLPPDEPARPVTGSTPPVANAASSAEPASRTPARIESPTPSAPSKVGDAKGEAPLGNPDPDRPEYLRLAFNDLAGFDYDPFEAGVPSLGATEPAEPVKPLAKNAQIPARILALNGKKAAVAGFMVPIEIRKDQAKSFLLVRNQMLCCFGVQIGFNEWVFVEMEGDQRATFVPDVLVRVYGVLEVGEDVQDGMVMSIYRMKANEVVHEGGK